MSDDLSPSKFAQPPFEVAQAHCAVEAFLCVPILVLGFLTYTRVRRHHDPVRKGVKWLHLAFWLYFLGFVFGSVDYGFGMQPTPPSGRSGRAATYKLMETRLRLGAFATLFRTLGDCSVMACIAGIAVGIYRITNPSKARLYKGLADAFLVAVALLVVIVFSGYQWLYTMTVGEGESRSWYWGKSEIYAVAKASEGFPKARFAVVVLLLFASVTISALALSVWMETRERMGSLFKRPLRLLIVASWINIMTHGYAMAPAVLMLTGQYADRAYYIAELVVDRFATVLILAMLFAIASMKANGLWSTSPPDTNAYVQQMYVSQPYQPPEEYPDTDERRPSKPVAIYTPSGRIYSDEERR